MVSSIGHNPRCTGATQIARGNRPKLHNILFVTTAVRVHCTSVFSNNPPDNIRVPVSNNLRFIATHKNITRSCTPL